MIEINKVKYYTPKEIAIKLTISDRTVYAWIRDGKIKYKSYLVNRILISETELRKFAEKHGWAWMYKN